MSWRQASEFQNFPDLEEAVPRPAHPLPTLRGFSPGLAVVPRAGTLPSSSVSETRMVFAEGPDDFLGDFPERRWATVFPEAGCDVEFTVLLMFLVFVYREQVTDTFGYSLVNRDHI